MKSFLLAFIFISNFAICQETPLTYSRVFVIDSASKNDLYDKALIWCSKSFNYSKAAINVSDKASGIIGGKAGLTSYYKVPKKKDSIQSSLYSEYTFDWLIEVKDGKLRFSLKNVAHSNSYGNYPLLIEGKPPGKVMFMSDERNQMEWDLSKKYFLHNMDEVTNALYADLASKKDNW